MESDNVVKEDVILDDLMKELGNCGRFQLYTCFLTCIAVILSAVASLSYVFVAGEVPHRCLVPECESLPATSYDPGRPWLQYAVGMETRGDGAEGRVLKECSRFRVFRNSSASASLPVADPSCPADLFDARRTVPCEAYVYDNDTRTVVNEWRLVCADEWKRTFVGTIGNLGQFFGLPIAGYMSDRVGRRTVLAVGATLLGAVGLARSFVTSYVPFILLCFLEPVFGIGIYTAAFVLCLEMVDARGRVAMGVALNISFAAGETLLGGLAWVLRDWRVLHRVIYSPALSGFLYMWLLSEPVRWLMARGRLDDARTNLEQTARCNRVTLDANRVDRLFAAARQRQLREETEPLAKLATFASVLRSRVLLLRFLDLCFCWLTSTFVFYGLSLFSVSIRGNVYRNFMLASAVEVPAYLSMLFVTDRLGRRWCVCCGFAVTGCGCYILMAPLPSVGQVVFLLISKFSITLAFAVLYVYAAELFPTPIRHCSLSACAMVGRVGSVAAPMTPLLTKDVNRMVPLCLFGSMAVVASVLTLLLPETVRLPLPNTVAEAENLGRGQRRLLGPRHTRYGSTGDRSPPRDDDRGTAVPDAPPPADAPDRDARPKELQEDKGDFPTPPQEGTTIPLEQDGDEEKPQASQSLAEGFPNPFRPFRAAAQRFLAGILTQQLRMGAVTKKTLFASKAGVASSSNEFPLTHEFPSPHSDSVPIPRSARSTSEESTENLPTQRSALAARPPPSVLEAANAF